MAVKIISEIADAEQRRREVKGVEAGQDKNRDTLVMGILEVDETGADVDGTINESRSTKSQVETGESSIKVAEEKIVNLESEKMKPMLTSHSMHCPKCMSEIPKIVLRPKVLSYRSTGKMVADTDLTPDLVGCRFLSLFTGSGSVGIISSDPESSDSLNRSNDQDSCNNVRGTTSNPSSSNEPIQLDPKMVREIYVPDWPIANNDSVVAPDLAKLFVCNLGTPADYLRFRSMGNSDISDLAMVNQAQSNLITSELHRRWVEAVVENNKLKHHHMQEIEKLKKSFDVSGINPDMVARSEAEETLAKTKAELDSMILAIETQRKGFQIRIDDLSESYEKQAKMFAELTADHARLLEMEKESLEKISDMNKSLRGIENKSFVMLNHTTMMLILFFIPLLL